MKNRGFCGWILALCLVLGGCAAEQSVPQESRGIDRAAYLAVWQGDGFLTEEEADAEEQDQTAALALPEGQEVRYAVLEKDAGTFWDGADEYQTMHLSVYAKYVYDTAEERPVQLVEVRRPQASLPGIDPEGVRFHQNEWVVEKTSETLSTVRALGQFSYTKKGTAPQVGGDVASVVKKGASEVEVNTTVVTYDVTFTANDCAAISTVAEAA